MPNHLTDLQSEYLEFIREYIKQNECAPRLEEIADHFSVTKPTANKALNTLQEKGYLYFKRDKVTGFYIRTPEILTPEGTLREIMIAGKLDRYGEVHEFPNYHGHFPFMLPDDAGDLFALDVYQHIPSADILARDRIIFAYGGVAKPGDICLYPYGNRNILVRVYEINFNENGPYYSLAIKWEDHADEIKDHLFWWPLAINEENKEFFANLVEEQQKRWQPIPPNLMIGKAVRLVRRLAI